MEVVKEWVRNVFIFVIALTFIEMLLPSSNIKPYIQFVFSLAVMATILTPLFSLVE